MKWVICLEREKYNLSFDNHNLRRIAEEWTNIV